MTHERLTLHFNKLRHKLVSFAISITGSTVDAYDIVADAFIDLIDLEEKVGIDTYLHNNVRWRCYKKMNRNKVIGRHHSIILDSMEQSYMIKADTQDSIIQELHVAIDRLPIGQRIAFKMRYIEGMKPREVCKTLNIKPGTLDNHIMRAKHKLREQFKGREVY